jgi:molecular chaperone HtpG
LSLRESVEAIPADRRRQFLGVHAPFLMAVLRIADYLQIKSARAPKQILKVRSLRSPVSQGEWKAHQAIVDINPIHEDPEAIFVIAKPEDVATYLRLRRLLAGMQQELDGSWALIGEVYGRFQELKELGLTLRRVRSNLDNKAEFAKTVSYHPERVLFEADPEILKLLVAPLYGDKLGVAIRELVQNAVDACLEREDRSNASSSEDSDSTPYAGKVTVNLTKDEKGSSLTVHDNGIGMTPEIVQNYFLKAGASFRRSDAWKKEHEDQEGKSRVLRSGRFGIGILAAFLLGETLEVESRHVTSAQDCGVRFKCSIDDESIELQRATIPKIGTTIRIALSENTFKRLQETTTEWDWFYMRQPLVERRIATLDRTEMLEHEHYIPAPDAELTFDWHRIVHKDFADIQWCYGNRYRYGRLKKGLFCNGIRVGNEDSAPDIKRESKWPFSLTQPTLSILDREGKLPLNLQRAELTRELPFENELLEDVLRDLVAFLLVNTPEKPPLLGSSRELHSRLAYPGIDRFSYRDSLFDWYWCTPEGMALASVWALRGVSPSNLYLVPSKIGSLEFDIPEKYSNIVFFGRHQATLGDHDEWIRLAMTGGGSTYRYGSDHWLRQINTRGRRILMSADYEERLRNKKVMPKMISRSFREEWRGSGWLVLCTTNCPDPSVEFSNFAKNTKVGSFSALCEWYIDSPLVSETPSELESKYAQFLERIMKVPVVPFDPAKRQSVCAATFVELQSYIKKHLKKS